MLLLDVSFIVMLMTCDVYSNVKFIVKMPKIYFILEIFHMFKKIAYTETI